MNTHKVLNKHKFKFFIINVINLIKTRTIRMTNNKPQTIMCFICGINPILKIGQSNLCQSCFSKQKEEEEIRLELIEKFRYYDQHRQKWKNLSSKRRMEFHNELKDHDISLGIFKKNAFDEPFEKINKVQEEKICSYCKNELESDALFCRLCGKATNKSRHIPASVKREVWRRDEGRCVECGSKENLEYDHIIPFSKGGSNTARNIQILCENCNSSKRDNIE